MRAFQHFGPKTLFLLLILISFGGGAHKASSCPPGEVAYNRTSYNCSSEYCPRGYGAIISVYCKTNCTCGFNELRSFNGTCIPSYHCPPQPCPGENEMFMSCQKCDKCSDLQPDGSCTSRPYGIQVLFVVPCQPGCYCKEGFYRNNNQRCVHQSQCPKKKYRG